ncbi:uncharacterized protein LOC130813783 [Amaranthus tricolor]|uniref:uncharacterized protein LOC130813783 n=1 Tax=Amaranthus tricolor TaxID=29722 RepID=UPI0025883755|nr:uncharacterized protein LOC130813783 [Amaranthus tricolor]XP_057535642.1 uncharacterized protein LOC130813783 [Amaranthus tricolor]
MTSDVPIDYAVFQLSPGRSCCDLLVSYDGTTERLASGLVKPFVTHLKVAQEQIALAVKSIKLEVDRYKNAETWFTKGTVERFVQFVGTPDVLEMVNKLDTEMSQLEAARRIYSQGEGDDQSNASGGDGPGASAASDTTKKELLRAIDVRLVAVKQDLTTACTRASAAGFNPETISELQLFADRFGAHRLSEACSKFITLSQQHGELFNSIQPTLTRKSSSEYVLRSSFSSDMSIDEPCDDHPKQSTIPNTTTKITFPLRQLSWEPSPSPVDNGEERENNKDKTIGKDKAMDPTTSAGNSKTESDASSSTSTSTPQLTRRLSVQERISMFENKAQKEGSPTISTVASGGGKPELRRLSSDVTSSTDKAVLRRWSGASDMSIDVSGDRKEPDSNANTPTPTSTSTSTFTSNPVFPPKPKDQCDLKMEGFQESKLPVKPKISSHLAVSFSGPEDSPSFEANTKITSFSGKSSESVGSMDESSGRIVHSTVKPFCESEGFGLENQPLPIHTHLRSRPGTAEQFSSSDEMIVRKAKSSVGGESKPQEDNGKSFGASASGFNGRSRDLHVEEEYEDKRLRDQQAQKSTYRTSHKTTVKIASESVDPVVAWPVNQDKKGKGDSVEKQPVLSCTQMEDSGPYRGKVQGCGSSFDQEEKPVSRWEESDSKRPLDSTGKFVLENKEVVSSSSVPVDQVQRIRQTKGNLGMNDDLKMKANELEKLFAEHKLRAPGDQSNSARRTWSVDTLIEQEMASADRKQAVETSVLMTTLKREAEPAAGSSSKEKNYPTPLMKTVHKQEYDVTPKQNIYSPSFADDSRGKLYQKYMQKRYAKLKEDWSSKGAQKEAKMKAMQDSLEKTRAEMKVKLAGSADKKNSAYNSVRRADKMRSFHVESATKRKQHIIDVYMSDEDEEQGEVLGKKLSETYLEDSSGNAHSKKVTSSKSAASSTPRNSAIPIPRSSGKVSNSTAGRRTLASDNALVQSVSNFSDLRKENTKPLSAGRKPVRPQRNHARKKSVSEDLPLFNEEKPRRSHSLRKSTSIPMELNDSRNCDVFDESVFMLSKYGKEENGDHFNFSRDIESKPFPKKGNGDSLVAGGINGHDFDDASLETEARTDVAKDEEDDFETTVGGKSADMDNSKGRLSQESDNSANSGYGNINALGSLSQAGHVSATELPTSMSSLFRSIGSIQDSPGGSPGSWNQRVHNPFSFSNEISDIDASDSPLGSPAWNSYSLAQNDDDARTRKKWGAAQKPIVGDSSHSLSRKDVAKGFKRFLKFGRKNRAAESMADWISATTSEGDDDTEDGRDLANRSSEDLRKSRMGFSHSHHSDEGFNESESFSDQVHGLQGSISTLPSNFKLKEEHLLGSSPKAPKSFFSLSNFRSKGSESKFR